MAAPNIEGFAAAQDNLRAHLGQLVTFKVPVAPTWPEGTKINPDTDEPYDATIKRTDGGFTTVVKRVLVIIKQASPLRPQSDTKNEPSGEMSGMDITLDVSAADFADIANASEMVVNSLSYRIREVKPFGLGDVIYRYLVYGMER